MAHDWKRYPELTNNQMTIYYFESPHKQIFEDFEADVINVHDGDTIRVKWSERDFTFPVRFGDTAAPELNERGGVEAKEWLENRIQGKRVTIRINPNNRVEKWGRLLGEVIEGGQDVGQEEIALGLATNWANRKDGTIPRF